MAAFDNIAPEANYLMDPEIANPNMKIKIADDLYGNS